MQRLRSTLPIANHDARMNELLEEHSIHHKMIMDLLEGLTGEQLKLSAGKEVGTLGMQFRHIADIEACYVEALKTGNMDFTKQTHDRTVELDKERLLASFRKDDDSLATSLSDRVNKATGRFIDWRKTHQTYGMVSVEKHLMALIEHEVLHEGELVVYLRTLGLNFPASWKFWGLG